MAKPENAQSLEKSQMRHGMEMRGDRGRGGKVRYRMGVASERTGIPPTVLRTWEARYAAVVPERSEGGHRLYSRENVERLILLRRLVDQGHRISHVARLRKGELRRMLARGGGGGAAVDRILEAGRAMDADAVEAELRRSALDLGAIEWVEQVLLPLLKARDLRRGGELELEAAYLVRGELRRAILWSLDILQRTRDAVVMAVRPLPRKGGAVGRREELAAMVVAVIAAQEGWGSRVVGAECHPEELGATLTAMRASMILFVDVAAVLEGSEAAPGGATGDGVADSVKVAPELLTEAGVAGSAGVRSVALLSADDRGVLELEEVDLILSGGGPALRDWLKGAWADRASLEERPAL